MRFPNLIRLEERRPDGCDEIAYRRLRRVIRGIRERTGADCWFNRLSGELSFGYVHGGRVAIVQSIPMLTAGRVRRFDPASEQMGAEDIVHVIQLAKVSPARKAAWERQWQERRRSESAQAEQEISQEATAMALDRARSYRRREGMGRHFKGQAVVSGLA
jgi:hypothetical protein